MSNVELNYDATVTHNVAAPRLNLARIGRRATISGICVDEACAGGGVEPDELERRLLEMGFVEGAEIEVLHTGLIGGDPIAVRLGDTRIALRRREARAISLSYITE